MPLHGMAVRRSLQERGNVFTEHTFAFSLPGFSYSVVGLGWVFSPLTGSPLHRIIECLKLEGSPKDHQVQLPAPHRTT